MNITKPKLKIGNWNAQRLNLPGKIDVLPDECDNNNLDIVAPTELHWPGQGKTRHDKWEIIYSGPDSNERERTVGLMLSPFAYIYLYIIYIYIYIIYIIIRFTAKLRWKPIYAPSEQLLSVSACHIVAMHLRLSLPSMRSRVRYFSQSALCSGARHHHLVISIIWHLLFMKVERLCSF